MSKFDNQYLALCEKILKEGVITGNRTGNPAKRIPSHHFLFDLQEEFPILTVKKADFKWPVLEMLWIWQAQSNRVDWLHERGITIWDEWRIDEDGYYRIRDEEGKIIKETFYGLEYAGTIGTAYGYVVRTCDMMQRAIETIKNNPNSRRIISNLWQETYFAKAVLPPCVYEHQWLVINDALHLRVEQRSCDVGLGLPYNITQYATLLCMVAQATGLKAGQMTYNITDTHIYQDHFPAIEEMLNRRSQAKPAPKLWLNPEITDFFAFDNSKELKDCKLIGYESCGRLENKMQVSV